MIVAICIAVVVGMIIGRFFRDEENCPRTVLGWDCRGNACDHRKSELYSAKATMARNAEEQAAKNYWKGGNDA